MNEGDTIDPVGEMDVESEDDRPDFDEDIDTTGE
jgi:hypothetical protein